VEDLSSTCSTEAGNWWSKGAARATTLRKAVTSMVLRRQSCKVKGGSGMEE
jgi:hypothetical protein